MRLVGRGGFLFHEDPQAWNHLETGLREPAVIVRDFHVQPIGYVILGGVPEQERFGRQLHAAGCRGDHYPTVASNAGVEHNAIARFLRGATPYSGNRAKLEAWNSGEAGELDRLREENAELRKALAACEAKLKKR